ncbi:hypothetical protein KEM56_002460 [Ascosphaera pollenicola]|nr:hypothetical protein KEM56_002460 [Ascosphaera pollenicola]
MDHENGAFNNWATVVDCGDIPNTPFDKLKAIEQLTRGSKSILSRAPKSEEHSKAVRMLSIGGDHTIILRALRQIWGPVSVLHFDAHLDTWSPDQLSSGDEPSGVSDMTHGTMLHLAHEEGHMSNDSNYHVGSRCSLMSKFEDLDNDARCGFKYIRARQIDSIGIQGVIDRVAERVGDNYVYVSVDIDVLDPAFAPATGTAEPGGLTTRELLQILQGLSARGLKIVGADVVELSPPFDSIAEVTALAYVQVAYELLHWMVSVPVKTPELE